MGSVGSMELEDDMQAASAEARLACFTLIPLVTGFAEQLWHGLLRASFLVAWKRQAIKWVSVRDH